METSNDDCVENGDSDGVENGGGMENGGGFENEILLVYIIM